MSHECFADEVAIDFPSVGRAVERMRVSFHGAPIGAEVLDAPEPVCAEIRLSYDEACRGLVVPFEVPIRGLCPLCGGRGEVWAECCTQCAGTGSSIAHHTVRVPIRPGVADGATVRFRVTSPAAGSVRVDVRVSVRTPRTL